MHRAVLAVLGLDHCSRLSDVDGLNGGRQAGCQAATNRRFSGFILAIDAEGDFELLHDPLLN